MTRWTVLVGWMAASCAAAAAEPAPPARGKVILSAHGTEHGQRDGETGSYWRVFSMARTPVVRAKAGNDLSKSGQRSWQVEGAPLPPDGWARPDFDDRLWPRRRSFGPVNGRNPGLTSGSSAAAVKDPSVALLCSPTLALQCIRGKFLVPDPANARGLSLSITYRGGVVVYLNGTELARGHLPACAAEARFGGRRPEGKLNPDTPAEEYPPEAFFHPRLAGRSEGKGKPSYEVRVRRREGLAVPARLLRKGVNVLAVELHRASYFGSGLTLVSGNRTFWSTCGLVGLDLRAEAGVEPNVARPAGVRLWNCATTERVTATAYGGAGEPLRPIELVGVRNGVFCGQVVVGAAHALRGVRTEVTDLRQRNGSGRIPTTGPDSPRPGVSVSYVTQAEWLLAQRRFGRGRKALWDTLVAQPPAEVNPEKDNPNPAPRSGGDSRSPGAVQPV